MVFEPRSLCSGPVHLVTMQVSHFCQGHGAVCSPEAQCRHSGPCCSFPCLLLWDKGQNKGFPTVPPLTFPLDTVVSLYFGTQAPVFHLVHFGQVHHGRIYQVPTLCNPSVGASLPGSRNSQGVRYYCSQFTGEKMEAQRGERRGQVSLFVAEPQFDLRTI